MSRFIVIRHAAPEIDPGQPAAGWPLSENGRHATRELALKIGSLSPGLVIASPERKAVETGTEIAAVLDLGVTTNDALREQGLGNIPFLADANAFRDAVREHFRDPDRIVLGEESSADAGRRLAGALKSLDNPALVGQGVPLLVTHGRVLASYLALLTGGEAIPIWESLRMPDALLVDLQRRTFRRIA